MFNCVCNSRRLKNSKIINSPQNLNSKYSIHRGHRIEVNGSTGAFIRGNVSQGRQLFIPNCTEHNLILVFMRGHVIRIRCRQWCLLNEMIPPQPVAFCYYLAAFTTAFIDIFKLSLNLTESNYSFTYRTDNK